MKRLGHRGVRRHKTIEENTLEAFAFAFTHADGIETDVSVSADGTPYLVHDVALRYIPRLFTRSAYNLKGLLCEHAAVAVGDRHLDNLHDHEIAALRLVRGGAIPRLADLFALAARHPGKIINLELKGENSAAAAVSAIHAAIAAGQIVREQVIISSFDRAALLHVRELDPALRCGLVLGPPGMRPARIYPWNPRNRSVYAGLDARVLGSKSVNDIRPDFFIIPASAAHAANLSLLRRHFPHAQVMAWARANEKPLSPGITALIVNRP